MVAAVAFLSASESAATSAPSKARRTAVPATSRDHIPPQRHADAVSSSAAVDPSPGVITPGHGPIAAASDDGADSQGAAQGGDGLQRSALRGVPPGFPATMEGYIPTDDAVLAGRLVDGEARVSWEAVPHDNPENRARGVWVSDDDLALAKHVITAIVEAFMTGDRGLPRLLLNFASERRRDGVLRRPSSRPPLTSYEVEERQ